MGVSITASCTLPTAHGSFTMMSFKDDITNETHVALARGLDDNKVPMIRIHSECLTGEVLGSLKCDCGQQLQIALSMIAAHGSGILVYLRQEGRGIGIENKIRAYALQADGLDTVDANLALGLPVDARDYGSATDLLLQLGIQQCFLLSNNPEKVGAVTEAGIDVLERRALVAEGLHGACHGYLETKRIRMGHML